MKKLIVVLFILFFVLVSYADDIPGFYWAASRTGGGEALDGIDGQDLVDGYRAIVTTSTGVYYYLLDVDSAATESDPGFISPDTNAGDKRWVLINGVLESDNSNNASSGTGEDDLASTAVPANLMGTTGKVTVFGSGTITGTNDTKVIKLHFGTSSWTVMTQAAGDTNDWVVTAVVHNTAAAAQRIEWTAIEADGTTLAGYETATINTASAATVKLTGTCTNGSDVVTQTMWEVKLN